MVQGSLRAILIWEWSSPEPILPSLLGRLDDLGCELALQSVRTESPFNIVVMRCHHSGGSLLLYQRKKPFLELIRFWMGRELTYCLLLQNWSPCLQCSVEGTDQWFSSPHSETGVSGDARLHTKTHREGLWSVGWGTALQEPLSKLWLRDQLHPRKHQAEGQRWKPYRPFYFSSFEIIKKKNKTTTPVLLTHPS